QHDAGAGTGGRCGVRHVERPRRGNYDRGGVPGFVAGVGLGGGPGGPAGPSGRDACSGGGTVAVARERPRIAAAIAQIIPAYTNTSPTLTAWPIGLGTPIASVRNTSRSSSVARWCLAPP